jgi:hypothetical protein
MAWINLYRTVSSVYLHFSHSYMEGQVIITIGALPHRRRICRLILRNLCWKSWDSIVVGSCLQLWLCKP